MTDLVKKLLADRATDPRVCGSPEMELRWKAAAEITRLEKLLALTWDIARDNHREYRQRVTDIMAVIREKPEG